MALQEWTRIFNSEAKGLLHGDTWHLEFDSTINAKNPKYGWKTYFKKTNARFQCTKCRRSWPSNYVMVLFHMQLRNGEGTVKVRRLCQNCKKCTDAPMVDPQIPPENISTIMAILVKKIRQKCYNEDLEEVPHNFDRVEVNSPHEPEHCEGCMLGICARQ